jgi:hypothetical protein
MASNLQFDVTSRNNMLDSLETTWGTSPTVEIRTGAQPANCAAADSGTLLATITAPADFLAAAAAGAKGIANGPWTVTASASGTPAHFRLKSGGGTCRCQGTVGTASADMIVDTVTVTSGGAFNINSFTLTAPNP